MLHEMGAGALSTGTIVGMCDIRRWYNNCSGWLTRDFLSLDCYQLLDVVKRHCSSLECVLDELRGKNCSIFSSHSLKMALYIVLGAVRGKNQSFFAFHLLCILCK